MLTARLLRPPAVQAELSPHNAIIARIGNLVVTSGDAALYDGAYTAVPKAEAQTILPTKGKVLQQDVVVLEVPYYEVSNDTGGNTVYIAQNTMDEV